MDIFTATEAAMSASCMQQFGGKMVERATDCLLPVVLSRHVLQILDGHPESLRHVALHSICS